MRELDVIILEDDIIDQDLYTQYLRGTNCRLSFCETNELAIKSAVLQPPDVMIVDLGLPDGDGVKTVREVRRHFSSAVTFVLVATGSHDSEKHQKALDAGADLVMTKPLDAQKLRSAITLLAENSVE